MAALAQGWTRVRAGAAIALATALAAVAIAAAPTRAQDTPAADLPADFFGVNAGTLFDAPASQWSVQLQEMSRAGITLVRSDAAWATAEPDAPVGGVHGYAWGTFDTIETALAQNGLTWSPIIDYSAPWAASQPGNNFSPPASDAEYAAYAGALAKRYGPHGVFWQQHPNLPYHPVKQWEIWNEENGGYFWRPGPDPAGYVDLYLAARAALRAADPGAQAIVGGLVDVGDPGSFLSQMYAHRPDARGNIDAVGLHPYPLDGAQSAKSAFEQVADMRGTLNAMGDQGVPIDITEIGWTTQGDGAVSDSVRAQQLQVFVQDLTKFDVGVSEVMPYAWVTRELYPQADDWFGLFNWSGQPTLAGSAYRAAIAAATVPATTSPQESTPPASSASAPASAPSDARSAARAPTSAKRTHKRAVTRACRRMRRKRRHTRRQLARACGVPRRSGR